LLDEPFEEEVSLPLTKDKAGDGGRSSPPVRGAGLGLRRAHLGPLLDEIPAAIQFMDVAPENWLGVGGRLGRAFAQLAERVPMACHGLLLNLGGPDPIDIDFLRRLKPFLTQHRIRCYSDHLSFCGDRGLLYELLPMPFTVEAVRHVAARIRLVQDVLEQRIAIENASYYCTLAEDLPEIEFINAVLAEADCGLLLDLNNVYVNSQNHGYDPVRFLEALPAERITYAHIAGHWVADDGLIIDTHGAPVVDPVWQLLGHAFEQFGVFPTLLDRDENIPALPEVLSEIAALTALQLAHGHSAAQGHPRI
jgi:hypothetical protein